MTVQDDLRKRMLDGLPVADRRSDVAGVATAVLEGGDGPPMVLLHGPGAHAGAWLAVIPELVRTHRVVAPDVPGQGASTVTGAVDEAGVLRWLEELIEKTCAAPPVVVGQLTGATMAMRLALETTTAIERLVLVVPFGLAPFAPPPAFGAALGAYLAEPTRESHDELWEHCVADLDGLRARLGSRWEVLQAYNVDRMRTPSVAAGQAALMELFAFAAQPPASLARIQVPTSLVWGGRDAVVPLDVGKAASERYGWPLDVVDGAGNEPALEAPEDFLAAVRRAVESSVGVTA
jgi:pimeloyl-ACP methyl ester carboxylesterase